jgi:hypothetical protein
MRAICAIMVHFSLNIYFSNKLLYFKMESIIIILVNRFIYLIFLSSQHCYSVIYSM